MPVEYSTRVRLLLCVASWLCIPLRLLLFGGENIVSGVSVVCLVPMVTRLEFSLVFSVLWNVLIGARGAGMMTRGHA